MDILYVSHALYMCLNMRVGCMCSHMRQLSILHMRCECLWTWAWGHRLLTRELSFYADSIFFLNAQKGGNESVADLSDFGWRCPLPLRGDGGMILVRGQCRTFSAGLAWCRNWCHAIKTWYPSSRWHAQQTEIKFFKWHMCTCIQMSLCLSRHGM